MMLPPSRRAPTVRAILRRDRLAMEAKLNLMPTNGTPVQFLPPKRAENARFETDGFVRQMNNRRGRYSKAYSGGAE